MVPLTNAMYGPRQGSTFDLSMSGSGDRFHFLFHECFVLRVNKRAQYCLRKR